MGPTHHPNREWFPLYYQSYFCFVKWSHTYFFSCNITNSCSIIRKKSVPFFHSSTWHHPSILPKYFPQPFELVACPAHEESLNIVMNCYIFVVYQSRKSQGKFFDATLPPQNNFCSEEKHRRYCVQSSHLLYLSSHEVECRKPILDLY